MFRVSLRVAVVFFVSLWMVPLMSRAQESSPALPVKLQYQTETVPGSGRFHLRSREETWTPSETAIIVCDVWDYHHCLNAVRRLDEFAPRLNDVLTSARNWGMTIIHAPSDCMDAYADHPARQRAVAAPKAANRPHQIEQWCSQIPAEEQAVYPIDQSDGGEDDDPAEHAQWAAKLQSLGRNPGMPWQRQSDHITIDPDKDFISDRGDEVWNILESRGIKNVILTGVHVNMCVTGRPFGLRQMARNGKNVVLMRDMTDAMYNPQRRPYVSHYTGNDLVISHIERYIAPTITSDQLLGGKPFRFSQDKRPHLVLVIAEDPYDTKTTLPRFAAETLGKDFRVTILHSEEGNPNSIPGLGVLKEADVLVLSVRRRVLPEADMALVREFIQSGKPVIGLRTANHAFSLRNEAVPAGYADWPTFDADVFGGNYHGSYPDALRSTVSIAPTDKTPAIVKGVQEAPFVQGGHMYQVAPLAEKTTLLLTGKVDEHPDEPVAWTFPRADGGRSCYIALGHPDDFSQPLFRRVLFNACYWAAGLPISGMMPTSTPSEEYSRHWMPMHVPGTWEAGSQGGITARTGPGWYRCVVQIPADWLTSGDLILRFAVNKAPNPIEGAWVNGVPVTGDHYGGFRVPTSAVAADDFNLLVVKAPGPLMIPPTITCGDGKKVLRHLDGNWQFRLSADGDFSNIPLPAKFGGGADIVFMAEEPVHVPRPVTRIGEFTPGIEGPACDAQGNIYAVNFARQGTIGRVTPQGAGEVFVNLPEGSIGNGIRFNRDGSFFVADYTGHNVLKVDPKTREVTVHAHYAGMSQPNDLCIAHDGTLYASDPNWPASTGRIWRIDTDGTVSLVGDNLGTTNGIDISPDGKTLYVNESVQRNIWAFTIAADKSLTDKRLFKKFDDHGFDGMRCDVDGNLYITRYGKGTVVKLSPQAEILAEIPVLGGRPSNLCFGGPDGRTIYVTEVEHQRLVGFRVDRPGREWRQWER